jgi:RHS repeat-associated protein
MRSFFLSLILLAALPAFGAEREDGTRAPATSLDLRDLDRIDAEPLSGGLRYWRDDLKLGEGSSAFDLTRTWSPGTGRASVFGANWASALSQHLRLDAEQGRALFIDAQGVPVEFEGDERGMISREGRFATLVRFKRGWILEGHRPAEALAFDLEGRIRAKKIRGRIAIRYHYDDAGLLTAVSGAWGRLRLVRNEANQVAEVMGPEGISIRYAYTRADLTRVTRGHLHAPYGYDGRGRLETLAGGQARVRYDAAGRVVEIYGAGLRPTRLAYDTDLAGALSVTVLRGTTQVRLKRSGDGRRVTRRLPTGGTEVIVLDERFRAVSRTLGTRVWSWDYDGAGRLTSYTSPEGKTRLYYGEHDQPERVVLPGEITLQFGYDGAGRLLSRAHPATGTTTTRYDGAGRVAQERDARGLVRTFRYDERGYLSESTLAGQTSRLERGADGRLIAIHFPDGSVTRASEGRNGRLVSLRDETGVLQETLYDRRGRPLRRTDDMGRTLTYRWTLAGDLDSVRDELGLVARFRYDGSGELSEVTDGAGTTVRYRKPDANTRITEDPTSGTTRVELDAFGRVVREVRGGRELRLGYDTAGRIAWRKTPRGKDTWTYTPAGRPLSQTGPDGGFRFGYDPAGRLTSLENTHLEKTIGYGYDAAGQRTSLTLPWGKVRYAFDAFGRVERVTPPKGGAIEIARDGRGRRTAIRYPNGVTTSFSYTGRLLDAIETRRGSELISLRAYGYDRFARVNRTEDESGQVTLLERDPRGRVTSIRDPQHQARFDYDLAGNRTSLNDAQTEIATGNRLLRQGERRLSYDGRGALTEIETRAGKTQLAYDFDGHLTQATLPGGQKVRYGYSPDGTRLWRQQGGQTTHFLNDLADTVGEYRAGKLRASFVYGEGVDDVLAGRLNGKDYYYHYDQVRSVTALSDSRGKRAASYRYSPFGEELSAQGPAARLNPLRYTSRQREEATGLYHYRARTYSPELGRFTTPDPFGRRGGLNLYAYASNDPASFNDPYGLWPQWLNDAAARGRDALSQAATSSVAWAERTPVARELLYSARFGYGTGVGLKNLTVDTAVGLKDLAVGGYEMVRDETYGETWAAAKQGAISTWENRDQLVTAAGDKWNEFTDAVANDPQRAGEMFGYGAGSVALAAVGTKGLDKVLLAGRGARALNAATAPIRRGASAATAPIRRAATPLKGAVARGARELAERGKAALPHVGRGAKAVDETTDAAADVAKAATPPAAAAGQGAGAVQGPGRSLGGINEALRRQRSGNGSAGGRAPPTGLSNLDPNKIRFSQTTAGGNGRSGPLRESMMRDGWKGDPVDAVSTPDGVTTMDNTRVALARELKLKEIPVRVHAPDDPLPASMAGRFGSAKTWGEALRQRTSKQRPRIESTGTNTPPKLTGG